MLISQRSMPNQKPLNIQPKRILVITLRYLGDTLLVTPLISSLKQAYPNADIDVLLPASNAGMLEGNPDIRRLLTVAGKPGGLAFGKLLFSLFRRYDLAISTQAGDRPTLCAAIAGKTSIGFVPGDATKAWWKKALLKRWLVFSSDYGHAVLENLRFCKLLGIAPCYRLTPPQSSTPIPSITDPYVVLHIMPQWRYKQWHAEGWCELIAFLDRQGFKVVLTGSGNPAELAALREIQQQLPTDVINLAGHLSLAQLSALIGKAAFFVGPDTGITHLAAATGTLTFALFGPTDPEKWAPWPCGYGEDKTPFASRGASQVNNVYLLQGQTEQNCLPCQLEGCDRHRESYSACLDQLSSGRVIDVIAQTLQAKRP
ncbi:glycosyltransferase family 9 protein [Methylomonas sp. LW13]|uniref:glycosyltransferase family 9 protein n=1 Tax=unclassified Methylomonas TaxID=2608980 RepID=UPI00068E6D27|nr:MULTISPECIES: glycosyltransferase family 9 protein [unclassified Methylomonas]PKD39758.1 glycosyltransferase family 9 protein [Methylomonas sp. Kb3]QBC29382.1 glycosyltransferase family 9 protein [Methylomonas sp. LW13]